MKIIHRYIFRDLAVSFALSLVALNVVMMTDTLMKTTFVFTNVGASAADLARVILLVQPQAATYTMPLALMVSILLTYGRLNATQEVAVLRTGGMSLGSLAMPAFVLAAFCLALGLLLSCLVSPLGAKKTNSLIRHVLATRAPYSIKEGTFTSSFRDVVIFTEKKVSNNKLEGVFVHDGRDPDQPQVLTAKTGTIKSPDGLRLGLELLDGTMHIGSGHIESGGSATDITFDRYLLTIPIEAKVGRAKFIMAELTPAELLESARDLEGRSQRNYKYTLMELHRRFTMPLMNIAVVLFSIALSFKAGKTGKLGGIGMGLGVIIAFYILSATMESMFRSDKLHHAVAGWVPLLALMAVSVYLYRREAAR